MNYTQVAKLSRVSPTKSAVTLRNKTTVPNVEFDPTRGLAYRGANGAEEDRSRRLFVPISDFQFLHDYSMVGFGWDIAQRLAVMNYTFPAYLSEGAHWVYKAWAMLRFGADNIKKEDAFIIHEAHDLAFSSNRAQTASAIKALLLCVDATVENVADDLALNPRLIAAFEELHFNVIGRKQDLMFLRNVVYPDSRIDETLPDYRSRAVIDKMLMRIGYNSDRKTALFFSGFRPRGLTDQTVDQTSSKFQQALMQTGALMASSGMLWMDRSHTTISAARNFLQTSKLSGETVGQGDGMISLADAMRGELDRLSISTAQEISDRIDNS